MGGSTPTVKAPKANYADDIAKYVGALKTAMPGVLGLEQQYRPEWGTLNLADINSFLGGSGGQQGLIGTSGQLGLEGVRQMGAGQAQAYGQMQGNVPAVRGLLGAMDPYGAGQVEQSVAAANRAWQSARGLTPEEQRSAQQFAREAGSDRGRVMDNSTIAQELLNRESVLGAKRQEAQAVGQNAYQLSNNFYSAPGMQLLGNSPAGYAQGQNLLQSGMGIVGQNAPQMVDVGQGFNLGAAERQNQLQAQMANAQMAAANSSGIMGMIGGVGGGLAQGIGAAGSIATFFSDRRLKTDITRVGETEGGIPVYTFRYLADPDGPLMMGVMAQDLLEILPEAVIETESGFYAVDYSKIS